MRNKGSNNRGSALVWAVISIMLVGILVAAALSVGTSYAERSVHANDERQAYLTARGGAEAMVSQLIGVYTGPEGEVDYGDAPFPDSGSLTLKNFRFKPNSGAVVEIENCSGHVRRSAPDRVEVSVTATVGERSRTVKASLKRTVVPPTAPGAESIRLDELFRGLYTDKLIMKTKSAVTALAGTDIYAKNIEVQGNPTITMYGDFYKGQLDKDRIIENKGSGREKPFAETEERALPYDVYLDEDLIRLSDDNPTVERAISLDHVRNAVLASPISYSFVLCEKDAIPATGYQDLNGKLGSENSPVEIFAGDDTLLYVIKADAGSSMHLKLKKENGVSGEPEVYLFLDSGATLDLYEVDPDIQLFICGGPASTVTIAGNVTVTGSISAANLTISKDHSLTLDYTAPSRSLTVYWAKPEPALPEEPQEDPPAEPEPADPENPEAPAEPVRIETHIWSLEKYEDD